MYAWIHFLHKHFRVISLLLEMHRLVHLFYFASRSFSADRQILAWICSWWIDRDNTSSVVILMARNLPLRLPRADCFKRWMLTRPDQAHGGPVMTRCKEDPSWPAAQKTRHDQVHEGPVMTRCTNDPSWPDTRRNRQYLVHGGPVMTRCTEDPSWPSARRTSHDQIHRGPLMTKCTEDPSWRRYPVQL